MKAPKRKMTRTQWVICALIVVIFITALLIGAMRLMELNRLQKEKEELAEQKEKLEQQRQEAE